jgi:hypothetical protein
MEGVQGGASLPYVHTMRSEPSACWTSTSEPAECSLPAPDAALMADWIAAASLLKEPTPIRSKTDLPPIGRASTHDIALRLHEGPPAKYLACSKRRLRVEA